VRTQEEILERYRKVQENDIFRFQASALLPYLSREQVEEFVKPGSDLASWEMFPLERSDVVAEIKEYMAFAIDKAINHRGISADRSIVKMREWAWILAKDDLLAEIDAAGYVNYGAPKLKVICDHMGWGWADMDGLSSPEFTAMASGRPCQTDCSLGCDR
jgi:hypothetical protein